MALALNLGRILTPDEVTKEEIHPVRRGSAEEAAEDQASTAVDRGRRELSWADKIRARVDERPYEERCRASYREERGKLAGKECLVCVIGWPEGMVVG